jgi:hypothetical protein
MTVDDLFPRDGENLYAWLDRIDPATAAFANREDLTRAEKVAFTRGLYEGQWRVLFDLFEKLDRGVDDAERLVGMTAAGLLALKSRRTHIDFTELLRKHRDIEDSSEGAPDDVA